MIKRIICVLLIIVMSGINTISIFAEDLGENLALGKTVWATDQFSASFVPANVNDGNLNTSWASGPTLLEGLSGNYCYIAIDLGQIYNITSFIARSRRDVDQSYNRVGWYAQFSNDPNFQTYETVGRKANADDYASDLELSFEKEPKAYRYVRVAHDERQNMVISEIEVYGEPYFGEKRAEFHDVTDKLADSVNLLNTLGIMGEMEKNKFSKDMLVSRSEALDIVLKSASLSAVDLNEAEKLAYAEEMKIISSKEDFRPRDFVTIREFCKMMLSVLEYENLTWPNGVDKLSNQLGFLKVTSQKQNDFASRESVARIAYAALISPKRTVDLVKDNYFITKDGETLLEAAFGLKLYNGVVTANNATNLSEYSKKYTKYVEVDYKEYTDESGLLGQFIGRSVFFLVDKNDDDTIVDGFLCDDRDESLVISMNDVIKFNSSKVFFIGNENGKEDDISLSNGCSFIKNGVAIRDISESDFKTENGTLAFIDNNKDGVADTVYLNSPMIAIIDFCADDGNRIVFKGKDGSGFEAVYDYVTYYRNGRQVLSEQMSRNSLAYCYVSNNKKVIKIECFTNKIKGTVKAISNDCINVDGLDYKVSTYFMNHGFSELKIGISGMFLLDTENQIIALMDVEDLRNGEMYGILTGYSKKGLSDQKMKVFTQENAFTIFEVSDKLIFDGSRFDNTNIDNYLGELIIFQLNTSGQITKITTQYSPDNRVKKHEQEVSTAYYHGSGVYENHTEKANMLFPVDVESIVFTLPYQGTKVAIADVYESNYKAGTFANAIPRGEVGQLEYYNVDEFLTPQVVIKKIPSTNTTDVGLISQRAPEVYVFDHLSKAYRNGNHYNMLNVIGATSGKKLQILYPEDYNKILMYDKMIVDATPFIDNTMRILTKDLSDYGKEHLSEYLMDISDLKKGDIIRGQLKAGSTDEFEAIDRIFTSENFVKDISYISYGDAAALVNAEVKLRCGLLETISDGKIKMNISVDNRYYIGDYLNTNKIFVIEDDDITMYNPREMGAYVDQNSKIVIYCFNVQDAAYFIYN